MTTTTATTATAAPGGLYTRPWAVLLLFVLAHVLMRLSVSTALELDEAEQMVWSQHLALGYGVQPPLYTWLQWGFNLVFGPSLLSLILLKQSLLAGTYVLLWLAARHQGLGLRGAWWAAASLLLFPVVGWMAVRDLTHTVLLLFCTAWLYWALVRHIARPRPAGFVVLGVALAVGMLAKYSFALIAAALLGAALLAPGSRRALLARGWWLAPLVALTLLMPHASWALTHGDMIGQRMAGKLHQAAPAASAVWTRLTGLLELARTLLLSVLLWMLVAALAFGRQWFRHARLGAPGASTAQAGQATSPGVRLLAAYLLLVVLALLALVLVTGTSSLKVRWVEPMLILLPTAAFLWRPDLQDQPGGGRRFVTGVLCVAILGLVMAAARPAYNLYKNRPDDVNLDTAMLAQALRQAGYDGRSPIVITRLALGGSMRLYFPHAPVLACPHLSHGATQRDCSTVLETLNAQGSGWLLLQDKDEDAALSASAALAFASPTQRVQKTLALPYRAAFNPSSFTLARTHRVWLLWQPPRTSGSAGPPA